MQLDAFEVCVKELVTLAWTLPEADIRDGSFVEGCKFRAVRV